MKKLSFLILAVLTFYLSGFTQSCLPDGIILYNQAAIDNFQTNNPDCTEIEGDVTIGNEGYLTDINSLAGLNVITSIGGNLHIITNENLNNLSGLDALESISGNFTLEDNNGLTDFTGLSGLVSIGGEMYVIENDNLSTFLGMSALTTITGNLEIGHNLNFSSLAGLSSLTTTGGFEMNYIHNMPTMEGLSGLTQINGDLIINSCHALVSLAGLSALQEISGSLYLGDNHELISVEGLEALTTVGGDLIFGFAITDQFVSFAGLSSLSSIGGNLTIGGGNLLQNLDGLEALTSIGGELRISGNNQLVSLEGIANIEAQSIGSLEIRYNPSLSACDVISICDYLQIPGGDVTIDNNVSGCSSISEVNAACGTGISDQDNQLLFSLYPNPANEEVSIQLREGVRLQSVIIYNLLGKEVLTASINSMNIDISMLNQGIYVFKLSTDQGQSVSKLIVE